MPVIILQLPLAPETLAHLAEQSYSIVDQGARSGVLIAQAPDDEPAPANGVQTPAPLPARKRTGRA